MTKSQSHSRVRISIAALKSDELEDRNTSLDVLSHLRRNPRKSLAGVSRYYGIKPGIVRRYVGSALELRKGRYEAKPGDRLRRDLWMIDDHGPYPVVTHSSKTATKITRYHRAIDDALSVRNRNALKQFEGKFATINGKRHYLVTDVRILRKYERAGVLRIHDIYVSGDQP